MVSHASANPFAEVEWEELDYEYAELDRETVCLEVRDDSMLPIARPGQRVLCSRDQSVKDGDLVAVKLAEKGPLFKRAYYDKKRREWLLESINQGNPKPPLLVLESVKS